MKLQQLEERMANTVLVKQRECFVNETARLRDIRGKKGPTAALFRLKERIVGSKKSGSTAVVIRDPQSGGEVSTVQGIKDTTLKYCRDLLTNRAPRSGFEEIIRTKETLHATRMQEVFQDVT